MLALTTKVYDDLMAASLSLMFNVFVLEGGSRSSKTYSIIQFWIWWAHKNRGRERRVIVARLKGTWLSATVLKDFIDVLKEYGLYDGKNHNKTNKIYRLFDTEFWFVGLDDPQKIHGLRSDAFWINEAIEATFDDYAQLMQRCEGFAILDYNPSEEEHWIYDKICKRPKTYYSHSTMLDNKLIPRNAKEQILSYEPTEENYKAGTADRRKWMIYGLGKRAAIEGLVFENVELIDEIPAFIKKRYTGMDFGYTNDPTAIGEVAIDGNALYMDELCYQTRMSISDIVRTLKVVNGGRKIISESADPRLVDEIYNSGFNIHSVEKGPGSVEAGIEKMKTMKLYLTKRSVNAYKEFRNYTYQQDKTGKWLNKPVDDFNHFIDLVRYVVLMEVLGQNRKPARRSWHSGIK